MEPRKQENAHVFHPPRRATKGRVPLSKFTRKVEVPILVLAFLSGYLGAEFDIRPLIHLALALGAIGLGVALHRAMD